MSDKCCARVATVLNILRYDIRSGPPRVVPKPNTFGNLSAEEDLARYERDHVRYNWEKAQYDRALRLWEILMGQVPTCDHGNEAAMTVYKECWRCEVCENNFEIKGPNRGPC